MAQCLNTLDEGNMKMKRGLIIVLILAALSIPFAQSACLNPVTVDGYIFNMSLGTVSGANVTITVSGCSGSCCSANVLSQSNGYYVATGLQASSGDTVTSSAVKNAASGSNTGSISSFLISQVNVTLCQPPSAPSLTSPANGNTTHNGSNRVFSWTSGTDPFGFSIFDQFVLDSTTYNNTASPTTRNLSSGSHTWYSNTCNSRCCNSSSSRTVSVTNAAPTAPTLTAEPDTSDTSATLEWTSGTDSDGDTTRDEFQLSNLSDYSSNVSSDNSASSPKTVSSLSAGSIFWRVRTCDNVTCSNYSSDVFVISSGAGPSAPAGVAGGGAPPASVAIVPCPTAEVPPPPAAEVPPGAEAAPGERAEVAAPIAVDIYKAEPTTLRVGESLSLQIGVNAHTLTILRISGDTVDLAIASEPRTVSIVSGNELDVDVDEDGKYDITIIVRRVYAVSIDMTIRIWEAESILQKPTEIFIRTTEEIVKRVPFLPWLFLLMLVMLGFSIGAIVEELAHGRSKRVDQSLMSYVHKQTKKGYKESDIERKLLEAGWTSEEIRYAFSKTK